jgi:hypothetical protein
MSDMAASLADVKAQLKITDTTDDAYLTALIEDVTDYVQEYIGAYVVAHNGVTTLLDTAAGAVLRVPFGVRTVTSLSIAQTNQPDTGGSYAAVSAALIVLRPPVMDRQPGMPATEIHVLGSAGVFADAINGASLVADLGPLTTPDRVQRVVIDAVAAAYQARKAGGSGVIGAENAPAAPEWSAYFSYGSPQRAILQRLRGGSGFGIG